MAIYPTRYQARKAATGADVVVKVEGGAAVMTPAEYKVFRLSR